MLYSIAKCLVEAEKISETESRLNKKYSMINRVVWFGASREK